ncbi:DMT family transporter [Paenibacillus chartarius]|uniref:DMT family transporter n=1 Tax=Paenibacillus chartarius TaxID=747481 RepID=A0ABV6DSW9_9BACL
MMIGLWLALLAGSLVGLQNIFNSRVHERAGSWPTTALVLGLGFLASFLIGLAVEGKRLFHLEHMELWFWFSGIVGVGVVACMVNAMKQLGPTYTISIVMCSQLFFALIWDSFGWMGLEVVPFTLKQLGGVLVIVSGILLFKFGGLRKNRSDLMRRERA